MSSKYVMALGTEIKGEDCDIDAIFNARFWS